MKSKVITETTERKIYVISDRTAQFFSVMAALGVGIGILIWLILNFSWLFWIIISIITVFKMPLNNKIVSETRLEQLLAEKENQTNE